MLLIFLLLISLGFFLYKWNSEKFSYFAKRGIPFDKPTFLLGNSAGVLFDKESPMELSLRLYSKLKKGRNFYGFFEVQSPQLVICDPETLKQVTVKNVEHFLDHRTVFSIDDEPLLGRNLLVLRGQRWRDMRATLTPMFTGSKLRQMYSLFCECAENATQFLAMEAEQDCNNGCVEIEMKDFVTKFTNDVIASTVFGVTINSLKDKDNEFYKMGRRLTDFGAGTLLKFFLRNNLPTLSQLLGVQMFDPKAVEYFQKIVVDTFEYRDKNNVQRADMIQMMMETRSRSDGKEGIAMKSEWEMDDLVAQCIVFFFGGFETVSTIMSFVAQELIENPEVQERLIAEIDEARDGLHGTFIDYDDINKLKYLDMVVSETLRKYPSVHTTDRVCVKPFTFDDHGTEINLNPGDILSIPIYAYHYDQDNFPEPRKFIPERFNDENKLKIKPYTYLPFGAGPRLCIGSRFAIIETKTFLFNILSMFTFGISPKSQLPIRLSNRSFTIRSEKGIWVEMRPRY